MYFWLFIIDDSIKFIFSGLSKSVTVSHDGIKDQNKDEGFWYIICFRHTFYY